MLVVIPLLRILTAARAPVPGVSVAQGIKLTNRVCRVILDGNQLPRPSGLEETPSVSPLACIAVVLLAGIKEKGLKSYYKIINRTQI